MADQNDLTYHLQAQDDVSPALQRTVTSLDNVRKAVEQLNQQMAQTGASQNRLAQSTGQLQQSYQGLAPHVAAAKKEASLLGESWSTLAVTGGVALGAVALVSARLLALAESTAKSRLALRDLNLQTGLSLTFLQALENQALKVGVSVDTTSKALATFTAQLGQAQRGPVLGGAAYGTLVQQLGLTPEQLAKPQDALQAVAKAIEQLPTAADRSAARMILFGQANLDVARILAQVTTESAKLREEQAKFNEGTLKQGIDRAQEYQTKMAALGVSFDTFWQGFAVKAVIPAANSILGWMLKLGEIVEHVRNTVQHGMSVTAGAVGLGSTSIVGGLAEAPAAYRSMFEQAGKQYALPQDLLARMAQVESGFNPIARSSQGARGIMQIMPATAQGYGADLGQLDRPEFAIPFGAHILSDMRTEFSKFADALGLAVLAYRAGTVDIHKAISQAQAAGLVPSAASIQPFVTPASQKYYRDIFGGVPASAPAPGATPASKDTTVKGLDAAEMQRTLAASTKAAAEAQEQENISLEAAAVAYENGTVAARKYTQEAMQALRTRQVAESQGLRNAHGGFLTPEQSLAEYRRRLGTAQSRGMQLTGESATAQAEAKLPGMEALLERANLFTERPGQNPAQQAQAAVQRQSIALREAIEKALSDIERDPALQKLRPELQKLFEAGLEALPGAIEAKGKQAFALIAQQQKAELTKIAIDIGAASLTPLDAQIENIKKQYTDASATIERLRLSGTVTPDLTTLLEAVYNRLGPAQVEETERLTVKATQEIQRHIEDLSSTLAGSAQEPRQRELTEIQRWGENMRAEIDTLLRTLPAHLEELRPRIQNLLNQITPAQQRKILETSDAYKMMTTLAHDIEGVFMTMWERIFSGGVQSFRDFGLLVLQQLQQLLGQFTAQLAKAFLNAATGTTDQEGGAFGALAKGIFGLFKGGGSTAGAGDYGLTTAVTTGGVGVAGGGIFPYGLGDIRALARGGIIDRPSFALLGEQAPGTPEAVIPMPNGRVPVAFTNGGQPQRTQPMIIELHQDFSGAIDPRSLRTSKQEVHRYVIEGVSQDTSLRTILKQYTK
jgi:hypothetical protein